MISRHLEAVIRRQRGGGTRETQELLKELEKMPEQLQLRLYHIINDLEQERDGEARKRRQGRFW